MKLTVRNKKMLFLLLAQEDYVTVRFIAEQVNVSSRTVLRELNSIENWLNKNNISMDKKKGIGIRINLQERDREALLNEILKEKADWVYSPEERLTLLKTELLKNSGITKLYTLTRLLDVTEATISSDLDKLEAWMNKFHLQITKKPGLGVYVTGDEIDIRSAVISMIYEQFHEAELIKLIFNQEQDNLNMDAVKTRMNQGILDIIDLNIFGRTQKLLRKVEKETNCQFADNSYIALAIRISVTSHRCLKGNFIGKIKENEEGVPQDKLYCLVKEWFISQENQMPVKIPEEEISYLAIHIRGAETQQRVDTTDELSLEETEFLELTKEVIYIAERETSIYLEDNEKLLRGLANHLKMAVYRIKMHLDIMNPLLEDIKEMYPDIFQAAAKCAQFIEERENILIPEDEIAYLASHIGAAVKEEKDNIHQVYHGVVACTNDMGAGQLLVSEIEREFPNIKIYSIISVMDINIADLTQKHIDIIITTVELQVTELPVILVNPILNDRDRKKIRDVMENFLIEPINYGRLKNIKLEDKIQRLKSYCDFIQQILHNFLFIEQVAAKDMNELNLFISRTISKTKTERIRIEEDLKNSEKKGAAILDTKGMVLYHCYSKVIEELDMMVVRLKDSINTKDKRGFEINVGTVIVLAMPSETGHEALELINEMTRKIINTDFALILKEGGKKEIMLEMNAILDCFVQTKAMETNGK